MTTVQALAAPSRGLPEKQRLCSDSSRHRALPRWGNRNDLHLTVACLEADPAGRASSSAKQRGRQAALFPAEPALQRAQ